MRYIDTLLAAFEVDAAGDLRGRPVLRPPAAFPDAHGLPTCQFPTNDFARFLPLPRVKEIAWRVRLYGSAQTEGGAFNDGLLGPTVGWRDLYADGIGRLDHVAGTIQPDHEFRSLSPEDQGLALDTVASDKPDFWDALVEHTLEGTFGAPEYGGNQYTRGWHLARWDGDSAPLGHAVYDESIDAYVDNAKAPTAQPQPGDTTEDFDADILNMLTVAAVGSGGKRFF